MGRYIWPTSSHCLGYKDKDKDAFKRMVGIGHLIICGLPALRLDNNEAENK